MTDLATGTDIGTDVTSRIDGLPGMDEATRAHAIDGIVRVMFPSFLNWTPKFCRVSGDVYGNHRDDVTSIVAERVLTVLREFASQGKHAGVQNWYSYLYSVSRYAALAYFNSSQVTAASGMTALLRRQRHIGRIRSELRGSLGREPSDMEIVEAANQNMRERRSNPSKQGALVDLSDMTVVLPAADVQDYDREVEDDEGSLLAPVEGRMLVTLIVDACAEISDELGTVAQTWIGEMYSEPPAIGSVPEIASALGVNTPKATRLLAVARGVAKDLCERKFGINFPG